jgi:hypothetical protein
MKVAPQCALTAKCEPKTDPLQLVQCNSYYYCALEFPRIDERSKNRHIKAIVYQVQPLPKKSTRFLDKLFMSALHGESVGIYKGQRSLKSTLESNRKCLI